MDKELNEFQEKAVTLEAISTTNSSINEGRNKEDNFNKLRKRKQIQTKKERENYFEEPQTEAMGP
jgi:hypothetical protein